MAGVLLLQYCKSNKPEESNYVVMLSLDGFRWDYPDSIPTPNLDQIAKTGVKAKSLQASFPTKTFPNHYSMATGLYPDHHGIVLNSFYDPKMDAYYAIRDREAVMNAEFYGGEPIWVTAEKQGITAASCFWVGSEAAIKGISPTYWKQYEHQLPFEQRIDTVIHWLSLPEKMRPHLITWYIHEPDAVGHRYGPFSPELSKTVTYLDSLVGIFIQRVNKLPYAKKINIIVTSDHGMGCISEERVVYLDDFIKESWVRTIQGGNPNFNIMAQENCLDSVYSSLKALEHISVWKSSEVPERFHYGNNPRITDIVVLADSAWSIGLRESNYDYNGGTHGYDNANTDMHAIFYACGPAFKKSHIQPTFNNTDLYTLIAHILGLKAAPNDGSFNNVKDMLNSN